jgi:hypothetical protein
MRRQSRSSAVAWTVFVIAGFTPAAMGADKSVEPPKGAPEYEAPPRATDGANMALTVQKLENGFDPDRPLLIWAIGSSFTNGLGSGDLLAEMIHQRFPKAPKIVYKKIAGNSTSYHFSHGWARHLVIPDQPDVVLIYNFGQTDDLEKMIAELRRHTTADIVVGSLHWCVPHKKVWPDPEVRNSHQDTPALRAMCEKYGVEFVENRREMTQYMLANKLDLEDLLGDSVHESRYAAKMTVMNIARHFHRAAQFGYDPAKRERRVEVETPNAVEMDAGRWVAAEGGSARAATAQGSSLTVRFTGSRIDLIGFRAPDGGTADVWIDGRPAAEADVFIAGYIEPDKRNALNPPNPPRDRCPHAVTLGRNLVPQKWTLTMTSDTGDYELVGSVTGPDGKGNGLVAAPFASTSGQIIIDPQFWRDPKNNRRGDRFTFDVVRPVAMSVDFKAPAKEKFRLRLAVNLPNKAHTLKLVARGGGALTVDAFDVFEPPLK